MSAPFHCNNIIFIVIIAYVLTHGNDGEYIYIYISLYIYMYIYIYISLYIYINTYIYIYETRKPFE